MPEPNLYKRGSTWWLRATVDGVEHRESLRCSDIKGARARRDQRLKEIEEARWSGPRHSWQEAVTAYLNAAAAQIGPRTLQRYALSLRMCEPFLIDKSVDAIDGPVIMSLISQRRKTATPSTIRRDLTAISQVLTHAEAEGWRDGVNPALTKRKTVRERRDPIVLPEMRDVEAVLARCNARYGALMRAALLTGCRQAELTSAEWRGFNAKARTLEIIGKGNRRRTISLSAEATAQIQAQPRTLGSDLIFCLDSGEPITQPASYFARMTARCSDRSKREGRPFRQFRFHDLRHLWAVNALRGGMGLYAIQQHLGHTSIAVTERVYLAFLTPEEAENAKRKMG